MAELICPEMCIRGVLKIPLELNEANDGILETPGWLIPPCLLNPMLLSLPTSKRIRTHLYCLSPLQQKTSPLVLHIQRATKQLFPTISLPPKAIIPSALYQCAPSDLASAQSECAPSEIASAQSECAPSDLAYAQFQCGFA